MRAAALALSLLASTATAQTCGGPVDAFIAGVKAEARAQGLPDQTIDAFFQGARIDQAVINADRDANAPANVAAFPGTRVKEYL